MSEALLDRAGLSRRWFRRGRSDGVHARKLESMPANVSSARSPERHRLPGLTSGWRPTVVYLKRRKDLRLKLEDPLL